MSSSQCLDSTFHLKVSKLFVVTVVFWLHRLSSSHDLTTLETQLDTVRPEMALH